MIDRFFGTCSVTDAPDNSSIRFDLGACLRRLVLFDTYLLKSIRLMEIPFLVDAFGVHGLTTLLSSGCLRIHCQVLTIGQTGQTGILESRRKKGVLPLGSYSFVRVTSADRREYLHDCLQNVEACGAISSKEKKALKRAILPVLVEFPPDGGLPILQQLKCDIVNNNELVKAMIESVLRKDIGLSTTASGFSTTVEQIDEQDFRVETDLGNRLGLSPEQAHKVVERALLGIGGLNQRIHEMKTYRAIAAFSDDDAPLFGAKLQFLARAIDPSVREKRFERVREVAGLPDLSVDSRSIHVDAEKLLAVRQTRECREFKAWLQDIDSLSDADLRDVITGLKAKLGTLVNLPSVRGLRFLATSGVSMVPGLGGVLGTVVGAIDTFLVERILPYSGPSAFIERMYPSIFHREP